MAFMEPIHCKDIINITYLFTYYNMTTTKQSTTKHNISQSPVHLCLAQAIDQIAHPKITPNSLLIFEGIFTKSGI